MRKRTALALAVVGCLLATLLPSATARGGGGPDERPNSMTLIAFSSEPAPLEGVEIEAVYEDGSSRVLGVTDAQGALEVPRSELKNGVKFILFCKYGFYCGALRTSNSDFFKYDERVISLARFMVL